MAARVSSDDTDARIRTEDLVGALRRELGEHALRIELRLDGAPAELAIPPAGTVQSLVALLKNALEASGPGDRVAFELRGDAEAVAFEVLDHGSGIPAEILEKVGDPFFTTKPPGRGLGLGVFLARVFFESRGGALAIDSQVGRGTRATARLPRTVLP
jgi:two-component system sensor histidine kinase RegB